jgi:protein TonB
VKAPVAISRVEPTYEACANEKSVWGFPILEAVIDEEGRVQNLRLLKPVHPCLEQSILPAIRQWRFKPGTLNGKPVPVIYNLTVHIHYR